MTEQRDDALTGSTSLVTSTLMAEDELSSLQAIFCFPGEFSYETVGSHFHAKIVLSVDCCQCTPDTHTVSILFDIHPDYPQKTPEISVFCDVFTKAAVQALQKSAVEFACLHRKEAMLLDVVNHVQEKAREIGTHGKSVQASNSSMEETNWTVLIHLDHMRARGKYVKLIEKWTKDFHLTGLLLFCGKLILIVLQGYQSNIKDYLIQHKSCNVDVDSRGHGCKERMLSVLTEQLSPVGSRFKEFQVLDCPSVKEVEHIFQTANLLHLYQDHVMGLKRVTGKQ